MSHRILPTTSLLLAALLVACSAPSTMGVATPSAVTAPALATEIPAPILCPAATLLEAKTRAVAANCVAATVGVLGASGGGVASGSGVVVSADGLVMTAGHVIQAPGTKLTIRFPDGRVVHGEALGVDRGADSGLAKIIDVAPPGGWPFAPLAPVDSAKLGDWVLATGNPGGVVVGRNPPLRLGRVTIHTPKSIQSDCTVVSGDSGGPLFDLEGRVVGIHSNVSLAVEENRHVPVGVFHAQWADLLAGKNITSSGGMLASGGSSGHGGRRHGKSGKPPAGPDAGKPDTKPDASKVPEAQGPVDMSRIGEALQKLVSEGDAEAKQLMEDAGRNGGQMNLDSTKAEELIRRAQLPAKEATAKGKITNIMDALKKLAETGHEEAKGLLEKAKAEGRLTLSSTDMQRLLGEANALAAPKGGEKSESQGIPDPSRVLEALNKLADAGDAEATQLLEDAKDNGGRIELSPEKSKELLARAKLPPKAPSAGGITNIQEALSVLAGNGDEEAKRLLERGQKEGRLAMNAEDVARLLEKANALASKGGGKTEKGVPQAIRPMVRGQLRQSLEQQFPGAKITDAILDRILDHSEFNNGQLVVNPDLEDMKAMGLSAEQIAKQAGSSPQSARVSQRLGETSLQALSLFAPALDAAGDCMVEVQSDGKPILMGTVVAADGLVVTKASDLKGKLTVVLAGGDTVDATVLGKDEATDLALLQVKAKGLEAAHFCDAATLGSWLVSPVRDPNRPAVGVVSVAERAIPEKFTHFYGEQKIMLGLAPRDGSDSCVVGQVTPDLPAAKAGVLVGDEVLALNGVAIKDWMDFVTRIRATKAGDTAVIKVRRDGKELELKALLGEAKVSSSTQDSVGETDQLAGGSLSKRRTHFPAAIQHDAVVWADQCGGPLVDLHGHVVGVNIARYDRVCTFAIPAKVVQETVAKLRAASEQTPQALPETKPAAKARAKPKPASK